jgi:YHS domain-containing protein
MIRYIIFILFIIAVYYFVKTVTRAVMRGYSQEEKNSRLPGDEMVLDPECRTYVVKDRAISRRIKGTTHFFCSEVCAEQYTHKSRS